MSVPGDTQNSAEQDPKQLQNCCGHNFVPAPGKHLEML